jgi:hypothetical protein
MEIGAFNQTGWSSGGYDLRGYVDDISIHDETCTQTIVDTLYASGTGCDYNCYSPEEQIQTLAEEVSGGAAAVAAAISGTLGGRAGFGDITFIDGSGAITRADVISGISRGGVSGQTIAVLTFIGIGIYLWKGIKGGKQK